MTVSMTEKILCGAVFRISVRRLSFMNRFTCDTPMSAVTSLRPS